MLEPHDGTVKSNSLDCGCENETAEERATRFMSLVAQWLKRELEKSYAGFETNRDRARTRVCPII